METGFLDVFLSKITRGRHIPDRDAFDTTFPPEELMVPFHWRYNANGFFRGRDRID
jgi:hypothetical protein